MKRARTEEDPTPVPSLITLASAAVPGPVGFFARHWAEDNDPRAFDMMNMYREIEANTNVTGRIPRPAEPLCSWSACKCFQAPPPKHMAWCPAFYESQERDSLHGKELDIDRRLGRFRGHARVEGPDHINGGVKLRVDSIVYPTAWLEIRLSPEQVKEICMLAAVE
jgi:hypothetical protein